MIEVEVKVSVKNKKQTEEQLLKSGFTRGDLLKESDFYFDSGILPLRANDKALRIRSSENFTANRSKNFMTFKGPKMDNISMTRQELEMEIEDAGIGREILQSLGYELIHPVVKLRQYFHRDTITACLDQVEQLGDFLELEIVVLQEKEKDAALEQIVSLLGALGYGADEIIRTSYLSMLQKNALQQNN